MSRPSSFFDAPFTKITYFFLRLARLIIDFIARVISFLFIPDRKGKDFLPPIKDQLLLMPATEIAKKIRSREVTSQHVVQVFINRIKETNNLVNAVIDSRFEEALEEARQVDKLLDCPNNNIPSIEEKPFLGVPYTGKDSIPVKGMVLTGGIYCRSNVRATEDCPVSRLIHESGAICLGVTNVPESTFWFDSHNMIWGRTNNPYDLSCIPGGSSGGNAAAIAACMAPFGVGGDLAGSIRIPCFYCGIFGHKTTPGIVPSEGQYPDPGDERQKYLSFGPMTRFAGDLIPMLKAMANKESLKRHLPDIESPVKLSSLKVFYMEDLGDPFCTPVNHEVRQKLREAVSHMKDVIGCEVIPIKIPQLRHAMNIFFENMKVEGYPTHGQTLTDYQGSVTGWWEFLKGLFGCSKYTMSSLAFVIYQDLFLHIPRQEKFIEMRAYLKSHLSSLLSGNGVLFFPTHPEPAIKHRTTILKSHNAATYTGVFSVLELPVTQCPLGLSSHGLPIGIQVISAPFQDRLTLAVAQEMERRFGGWVPPSCVDIKRM